MAQIDVQKLSYLFNKRGVEKETDCSRRALWQGWDEGTTFLRPRFILAKTCGFLFTPVIIHEDPSLQLKIWAFWFTVQEQVGLPP